MLNKQNYLLMYMSSTNKEEMKRELSCNKSALSANILGCKRVVHSPVKARPGWLDVARTLNSTPKTSVTARYHNMTIANITCSYLFLKFDSPRSILSAAYTQKYCTLLRVTVSESEMERSVLP